MAKAVMSLVLLSIFASAASQKWELIAPNPGQLTFCVGVGFEDEKTGILAGGANGVGPEILRTTDGGLNFTRVDGIKFGLDILLLAADASKHTMIVTSPFGELYSLDDGKSFHHCIGGGVSQSVRYVGHLGEGDGKHFGIAGSTLGGKQFVGLTDNGGISFKSFPTGTFTESRYAAYPTSTTFYAANGQFPNPPPPPPMRSNDNSNVVTRPRKYRKSAFQNLDGTWNLDAWKARDQQPTGYAAQIQKTVDGGKTWTELFALNGSFYFNEIDCSTTDPNLCCAAAEAGNESPASGAYIYCTTDGQNFKKTFNSPAVPGKENFSLMSLRFVGPKEAWACGGDIKPFGFTPMFLHTVDGGATWTRGEVALDGKGHVCLGLDMISPTTGFAAVDNVVTQTSGMMKYM